jgi:hypothetical protein
MTLEASSRGGHRPQGNHVASAMKSQPQGKIWGAAEIFRRRQRLIALQACQVHLWSPLFRPWTLKSRSIPLSRPLVEWLQVTGIFESIPPSSHDYHSLYIKNIHL